MMYLAKQSENVRGFTRVELLMVMFIVLLLTSVCLPAMQLARDAAQRTQSRNHLKQIGLALHNYHDVHRTFPPGWVAHHPAADEQIHFGWMIFLLPYVDQAPLYNKIDFSNPQKTDKQLLQTVISYYRSPADRIGKTNPIRSDFGSASYSGVSGDKPLPRWLPGRLSRWWPGQADTPIKSNGTFYINSRVRIREFTDGTSNTIMVGERSFDSLSAIWPGVAGNHLENDQLTDASHISGINKSVSGFSSQHPDGANFLFGDGRVWFLSDNLDSKPAPDRGIFQNLANKSDGQVIGNF